MIVLSLPPGINRMYGVARGGKIPFYKKKEVRDWEDTAGWEIKRQWKQKKPITGSVDMIVRMYYGRNRDIDGCLKVLLDIFQRQHVYENDMQVVSLVVSKEQDVQNPHLEVEITELVPVTP